MTLRKILQTFQVPAILGLLLAATLGLAHAKAIEGVVNVNTASVQELTLLPGIGKSKAEQIVQLRQAKPFASADDLKSIKGLGAKRLEALRPHIAVSGATTAKKTATPMPGASAAPKPPVNVPKI